MEQDERTSRSKQTMPKMPNIEISATRNGQAATGSATKLSGQAALSRELDRLVTSLMKLSRSKGSDKDDKKSREWLQNEDESFRKSIEAGIEALIRGGVALAAERSFDTVVRQKKENQKDNSLRRVREEDSLHSKDTADPRSPRQQERRYDRRGRQSSRDRGHSFRSNSTSQREAFDGDRSPYNYRMPPPMPHPRSFDGRAPSTSGHDNRHYDLAPPRYNDRHRQQTSDSYHDDRNSRSASYRRRRSRSRSRRRSPRHHTRHDQYDNRHHHRSSHRSSRSPSVDDHHRHGSGSRLRRSSRSSSRDRSRRRDRYEQREDRDGRSARTRDAERRGDERRTSDRDEASLRKEHHRREQDDDKSKSPRSLSRKHRKDRKRHRSDRNRRHDSRSVSRSSAASSAGSASRFRSKRRRSSRKRRHRSRSADSSHDRESSRSERKRKSSHSPKKKRRKDKKRDNSSDEGRAKADKTAK